MTDLLFIQKSGLPWHGVMSLSASLRKVGYSTDLILYDQTKDLIATIKNLNPEFIAFPVITGEEVWVRSTANYIKCYFPLIKVIYGGPHATFYPETLTDGFIEPSIFVGECDTELPRLLRALNGGELFYCSIERDLDSLPFPDRSIYYKYPHLEKATVKQFMTGRGCPFNCSFCGNHIQKKIYNVKTSEFVRRHSPQYVVDYMYRIQKEFGYKTASFTDDVFTLDVNWLDNFAGLYSHVIHVPFMCNVRADIISGKRGDEILKLLKSMGCYGVSMGIESGSGRILKDILNKGETVYQMISAGKKVKDNNLVLKTYNMIGIPTETVNDVYTTIQLNRIIKPDHTSCSFLTPYPRYDICKHYDVVPNITSSIYKPNKSISPEIVNLQTFFFMAVKMPWLTPLIKKLTSLPPNPLFRLAAKGFYGLFMAKVHRLTPLDIWRYARNIDPSRI